MSSNLNQRLRNVEDREQYSAFIAYRAEFANRSDDELAFFSVLGYWPEGFGNEHQQEFNCGDIQVTIHAKRVSQ